MRIAPICACVLAFLAWDYQAWPAPGGHAGGGGGGHAGGGGGGRASAGARSSGGFGSRGGTGRMGAAPPGASSQAGRVFRFRPPSPPPVGAINPGFANGLGNNVGLHAFPPVTLPPGVGNINQPGIQPGVPPAIPNINSPGVPPTGGGFRGPGFDGHGRVPVPGNPSPQRGRGQFPGRHFNRPYIGFGPIIYGVPYYYFPFPGYTSSYPYSGYYEAPPPAANPPSEQPYSEIAPPPGNQGLYVLPELQQPSQQAPSTSPEAKPVTLLAFKDHTIVAVTDYWLEGETLYYSTSYGGQTGIPLDQLDLPFTEQLNRERNLRFVLESR